VSVPRFWFQTHHMHIFQSCHFVDEMLQINIFHMIAHLAFHSPLKVHVDSHAIVFASTLRFMQRLKVCSIHLFGNLVNSQIIFIFGVSQAPFILD